MKDNAWSRTWFFLIYASFDIDRFAGSSRTFMRFSSDQIKFVAVDEPSSALDPEGELELFNNLREARDHKTMIFVTHRFGHLTKHADKIL